MAIGHDSTFLIALRPVWRFCLHALWYHDGAWGLWQFCAPARRHAFQPLRAPARTLKRDRLLSDFASRVIPYHRRRRRGALSHTNVKPLSDAVHRIDSSLSFETILGNSYAVLCVAKPVTARNAPITTSILRQLNQCAPGTIAVARPIARRGPLCSIAIATLEERFAAAARCKRASGRDHLPDHGLPGWARHEAPAFRRELF